MHSWHTFNVHKISLYYYQLLYVCIIYYIYPIDRVYNFLLLIIEGHMGFKCFFITYFNQKLYSRHIYWVVCRPSMSIVAYRNRRHCDNSNYFRRNCLTKIWMKRARRTTWPLHMYVELVFKFECCFPFKILVDFSYTYLLHCIFAVYGFFSNVFIRFLNGEL